MKSSLRIPALVLMLLAALLPGCTSVDEPGRAWQRQDLRALDPADAANPGWDLLAAYSRFTPADVQIRLDFLDLADTPDFDLLLTIRRSPEQPGLALSIPASRPISALNLSALYPTGSSARAGLRVRVLRDPVQDTLVVSIDRRAFGWPPSGFTFEAAVFAPDSRQVADQVGVGALPGPPAAAQVMLAFWDTYPVYTPAQALRRWDGAHTGPLGGRHGLSNLLRIANNHGAPLFLLDLLTPASLSALELVGGLSAVQEQAASGRLGVGQPVFDLTGQRTLAEHGVDFAQIRLASRSFGLPAARLVFLPERLLSAPLDLPANAILVTYPGNLPEQQAFIAAVQVSRQQGRLWLNLGSAGRQAGDLGASGFDLEARRSFINAALRQQSDPAQLLFTGGSLPASAWGNPQAARAGLAYIANHPWISLVTPPGLLSFPVSPALPGVHSASAQAVVPQPADTDPGALSLAYWHARQAMDAPVFPSAAELPALRRHYAGQTHLLAWAAGWAAAPTPQAGCTLDLDQDGQAECILASGSVLAVFEPERAALTHLFVSAGNGFHQLVGPSSQLISGLSAADSWDLSAGAAADPQVLPGAFWSNTADFQVEASTEISMTFFSLSSGQKRRFSLEPLGVAVSFSDPAAGLNIPLLLDPWRRFQPGGTPAYQAGMLPDGVTWEAPGGARMAVRSTAALTMQTFHAAGGLLAQPEDPNLDYPVGSFLPIPMALVEVSPAAQVELYLTLEQLQEVPASIRP